MMRLKPNPKPACFSEMKPSSGFCSAFLFLFCLLFGLTNSLQAQDSITPEESEKYGDRTVEQALLRLPGISQTADGLLNIRAAGSQRFNLTLDGRPVANSTFSNRSFLLSAMPLDLYDAVEVHRVNRPWMPADAIGASINLRIKPEHFLREGTELRALAGINAQTNYGRYGEPGARASVRYTGMIQDNLMIGARLAYDSDAVAKEEVEIRFGAFETDSGFTDALRSVAPALEVSKNERLGGAAFLRYNPTEASSYQLTAVYHFSGSQTDRHRQTFDGMGDWVRPDSTGAAGARGFVMYDVRTRNDRFNQLDLMGGSTHQFSGGRAQLNLNWSRAESTSDQLSLPFMRSGLNYAMNFENRDRPTMRITGIPTLDNGTVDYRNMRFQGLNQQIGEYMDNTVSAAADIRLDFLNLRAGVSGLIKQHDGFFEEGQYAFFQPLDLYRFSMVPQGAFNVFGMSEYLIPWVANTDNARLFFENSRPRFNRNENLLTASSAFRNYAHQENIWAGYVSTGIEAGPVRLDAGVRAELTQATYEGQQILVEANGEVPENETVSTDESYITLFPHVGLSWITSDFLRAELVYSRGIDRPDFFQLSPFSLNNAQAGLLFLGNPELKPAVSDQLDFILNFQNRTNSLSVNLFFKRISNIIFERSTFITDEGGSFDGFEQRFFTNSDEQAEVTGVEVSAKHQMTYLPGLFSGFGFIANYTFTDTKLTAENRPGENLRIPGHSPHLANIALFFEQWRISARVAMYYRAESFVQHAEEPITAPSLSGAPVFVDRFDESLVNLTYSFHFRISDQFTFWGDALQNLNDSRAVFDGSRALYPVSIQQQQGFTFRAGIRYQL